MSLLCKSLRIFALFTAAVAFFWILFAHTARAQTSPQSVCVYPPIRA